MAFRRSEPGEIVNAYSGMVLGDPGYSTGNGTDLIQWQWNGGLNQQWTLLAAGNGPAVTNYVDNAATGLVLDDPTSRPVRAPRRPVAAQRRDQPAVVVRPAGHSAIT